MSAGPSQRPPSSGWREGPAEFEFVAARPVHARPAVMAASAASSPPRDPPRPAGFTLLGASLTVFGTFAALPLLFLLLIFVNARNADVWGATIVLLALTSIGLNVAPIAIFALGAGFALLKRRLSIRWSPHVACVLLLVFALRGLQGTLMDDIRPTYDGRSTAPFEVAFFLSGAILASLGLLVLFRPHGRRYVAIISPPGPRW